MKAALLVAGCAAGGFLAGLLASANSGEWWPVPAAIGGVLGLVAGLALASPDWRVWGQVLGERDGRP